MSPPEVAAGFDLDQDQDRILILDFGSQYSQLIARRVREAGVYSELFPCDVSSKTVIDFQPSGIILSGGPESVHGVDAPKAPEEVFLLGVPVLGICYGMQTMAGQLGGVVVPASHREYGYVQVRARGHSDLLRDIEDHRTPEGYGLLDVWMSHGDSVTKLPPGFKVIASTLNTPIAGIADEVRRFYGLQFHPEVTHTKRGKEILERFCVEICGCAKSWSTEDFIKSSLRSIKREVGAEKVLLGLSGGVDSSVAASLLHRAIGDQLVCVFVDNGLLRLGEAEQVINTFQGSMGLNIRFVNAQNEFLEALAGVTDPEEKRKIIGKKFIEVFERESLTIDGVSWLAQGTIYPDVIESAADGAGSHVIKSHHNVGGLPKKMKLKLIEPLKELFKDEVRELGRQLGLPSEFINRHPFPGPGLAIRCIGEISQEKIKILREADYVFIDQIKRHKLYDEIWQAFVTILPAKTVGVMGDARTYDHVCALRAITSTDGMTADFYPFDMVFLGRVASRIVNEVRGINRVVYDVTSKPPGTIEWE